MRKHAPSVFALLETLESRQLLSSMPAVVPTGPRFVLSDASPVLLATLKNKAYTISEDSSSQGPNLTATINWGDGTTSDATLHRTASGAIQVFGGHSYAAVKTYRIILVTSADAASTSRTLIAHVQLNANRGRTLNMTAGTEFSGRVSTLDRARTLPALISPAASIALPAGARFAQFTVPEGGATASLRIDWGDGSASDGSFLGAGASYQVLGTHTYVAAGAYRIVTYVIFQDSAGTVLHTDEVSSTAHVRGAGAIHFSLPAHTQLSWADVLPVGSTIAPTGLTTSGGASAASGVLTVNGNGYDPSSALSVSGGVLHLGSTPYSNSTSGLLTSILQGAGTVHLSGSGSILLNSTANPYFSGFILNGGSVVTGGAVLSATGSQLQTVLGVTNMTLSSGQLLLTGTGAFTAGTGSTLFQCVIANTGRVSLTPVTGPLPGSLVLSSPGDNQVLPGSGTLTLNGTGYVATSTTLNTTLTGFDLGNSLTAVITPGGNIRAITYPAPLTTPFSVAIAGATPEGALALSLLEGLHIKADGTGLVLATSAAATPLQLASTSLTNYLSALHTGSVVFNVSTSAATTLSVLQALPADFAGTLVLPPGTDLSTLPAFSSATFTLPSPTVIPSGPTAILSMVVLPTFYP